MSTSGSYSFNVQATDIVREAMLNIVKLGEAEQPSAQEYTDCLRKLNLMALQWMGKWDFAPGLKMWKRRHGDMFLGASVSQYNLGPAGHWSNGYTQQQTTAAAAQGATQLFLPTTNILNGDNVGIQLGTGDLQWTTVSSLITGPPTGINLGAALTASVGSGAYVFNYTTTAQRPLLIETVVLRDVNYNDIPMNLLTLQEYDFLSSKAQIGFASDPTAIYYESQLTNGQLYIDCAGAQDVTKHLHISYMEQIQNFVNTTDNPDYPAQWYNALCWGLTAQIGPMFNVPFTKDMEMNLVSALAMAREADGETTALYFQCKD